MLSDIMLSVDNMMLPDDMLPDDMLSDNIRKILSQESVRWDSLVHAGLGKFDLIGVEFFFTECCPVGYQKIRLLRRFQKWKLTLGTKYI
jgi:hypothetical protein